MAPECQGRGWRGRRWTGGRRCGHGRTAIPAHGSPCLRVRRLDGVHATRDAVITDDICSGVHSAGNQTDRMKRKKDGRLTEHQCVWEERGECDEEAAEATPDVGEFRGLA